MTACVICQDREAADRSQVCDACPVWLAGVLRDIPALHAQLGGVDLTADVRGPHWRVDPLGRRVVVSRYADQVAGALPAGPLNASSRQGRVSGGSVEAATPLNLAAVDLALPATATAVSDPFRDQTGHPGVAAILCSWGRDWATTRAMRERAPDLTVPTLARWLTDRLDWACDHHPAIDEFAQEMRALRSTLRGVLGLTDPPTYHHGVPCPHCQSLALSRANGEAYIGCAVCGHLLSDEEYREWTAEAASRNTP